MDEQVKQYTDCIDQINRKNLRRNGICLEGISASNALREHLAGRDIEGYDNETLEAIDLSLAWFANTSPVRDTCKRILRRRYNEEHDAQEAQLEQGGYDIPHPLSHQFSLHYANRRWAIQYENESFESDDFRFILTFIETRLAKQHEIRLYFWIHQDYDFVRYHHIAAYSQSHARLLMMHHRDFDMRDDGAYDTFKQSDYDNLVPITPTKIGVF